MKLKHVVGDVVVPQFGNPPRMIAHAVNNRGGFGAGYALGLSSTYPIVREQYRDWFHQRISEPDFKLGQVQFVDIHQDLCVANMLCQDGYRSETRPVPFHYIYFEQCFETVLKMAISNGYEIHMPRVGTGLGGATWWRVEQGIQKVIGKRRKVPDIYVYELPMFDKRAGRPTKR